jgi:hypothetical protein
MKLFRKKLRMYARTVKIGVLAGLKRNYFTWTLLFEMALAGRRRQVVVKKSLGTVTHSTHKAIKSFAAKSRIYLPRIKLSVTTSFFWSWAGWPDSANFRRLGNCLLLGSFFLLFIEVAKIFELLFSTENNVLIVTKNGIWASFFAKTHLVTLVKGHIFMHTCSRL